jgi:hypothetical protein
MTKETTPAVVEPAGLPATFDPVLNEGMGIIDPNEAIISRVLCCQAMSQRVLDGKAVIGQVVDSVDGTVLAAPGKPVEVIAFHTIRQWRVSIDGKYSGMEMMTQENCSLPWEESTHDGMLRRDKVLGYFMLMPEEIEIGIAFPRLCGFSRTSYYAGRKLSTAQVKLAAFGHPLASKVFSLSSNKTENDKGTFYTFDVDPSRDATPEEVAEAVKWKKIILSGETKIAEETE